MLYLIIVFCMFIVLVSLSVLAKVLARKTPLRMPISWYQNIRSQDYSFPRLFVPMMELSFSRPFVPGNIPSRERMIPGRFVWTIRSQERISLGTFVPWTTLGNFLFLYIKENLLSKMANYIFT